MSSLPPGRSQPPVAVRVVRPYESEDALLASESGAFTRTGVVLVGGPSRPSGVVIRFEIALRDGSSVMRGEGRVVSFRPPTAAEEAALLLRFTRLDVKSKNFLDRAVAQREAEKSGRPSEVAPATPEPVVAASPVAPPVAESTPARSEAPQAAAVEPEAARAAAFEPEPEPERANEPEHGHADEHDHTVQAPPVAMIEEHAAKAEPPAPARSAPPPASAPAPMAAAPQPASERASLEPVQRESALDRLRARKRGGPAAG
jgi:pyruvate/2-oxoglutarate dehydrogenase complex dihydrolipoamide acyltransferase (E2) component